MTYRYLDIFDDSRTPAPDRSEVRRQCYRWTTDAMDAYNVLIISSKINSIANPYLREYTASIMHDVVYEQMANQDYECCFSQQVVEQIECDLKRIIKKARYEQIEQEPEESAPAGIPHADKQQMSRLDRMEEQMALLMKQVQQLSTTSPTTYCTYIVPHEIKTLSAIEKEPQKAATVSSVKFSYIKSDDPEVIKEIENTMAIYVTANKPSELCKYLFENEGLVFMKMPKHADPIFSCIVDRWGDQNHITKKGLRTAWNRHRPARL